MLGDPKRSTSNQMQINMLTPIMLTTMCMRHKVIDSVALKLNHHQCTSIRSCLRLIISSRPSRASAYERQQTLLNS